MYSKLYWYIISIFISNDRTIESNWDLSPTSDISDEDCSDLHILPMLTALMSLCCVWDSVYAVILCEWMKKAVVEDPQRPIHVSKVTKIHSGCALLICHLVCEHYGPYFFSILNNSWLWKYNTGFNIWKRSIQPIEIPSLHMQTIHFVVVLCSLVLKSNLNKVFKHCNVIRALKLSQLPLGNSQTHFYI